MSKEWNYIVSPPANALENMDIDTKLFEKHEAEIIPSTLRVYTWTTPCITYGYSQKIEKDFDVHKIPGWEKVTAKRPTGGGIVFHNPGDLTYCMAASPELFPPSIEESCAFIHSIIADMLKDIGIKVKIAKSKQGSQKPKTNFEKICFATPSRYELVTVTGKKITGSAQRRGKKTLLQQGTIPYCSSILYWEQFMKNSNEYTLMQTKSTDLKSELKINIETSKFPSLLLKHMKKNLP